MSAESEAREFRDSIVSSLRVIAVSIVVIATCVGVASLYLLGTTWR